MIDFPYTEEQAYAVKTLRRSIETNQGTLSYTRDQLRGVEVNLNIAEHAKEALEQHYLTVTRGFVGSQVGEEVNAYLATAEAQANLEFIEQDDECFVRLSFIPAPPKIDAAMD